MVKPGGDQKRYVNPRSGTVAKQIFCHELGHVVMFQNMPTLMDFIVDSAIDGPGHGDPHKTSSKSAFIEGFADFTQFFDEESISVKSMQLSGAKKFEGDRFSERQKNEYFVGRFLTILAQAKSGNYDRIVTFAGKGFRDDRNSSLSSFLTTYLHTYPDQKQLLTHLMRRYALLENEPLPEWLGIK